MTTLEKIRAEIENLTYDFIKGMVNKYAVLQIIDKYAEQEPCDKCVYSTKGGYCQYDDIVETIPPLEPCDDVVSREAVIEIIRYSCLDLSNASATSMMVDNIRELPSVRPQEQTGHWISHYDEDAKEGWYECDRCHTERAFNTDYCPDCGAKMVEPQESGLTDEMMEHYKKLAEHYNGGKHESIQDTNVGD